jgi:hypothetical protein
LALRKNQFALLKHVKKPEKSQFSFVVQVFPHVVQVLGHGVQVLPRVIQVVGHGVQVLGHGVQVVRKTDLAIS